MNRERAEILFGTLLVEDEQVVKGKGANIKIKRKVEQAVFQATDTHHKGLKILSIIESKVVGHTNYSK